MPSYTVKFIAFIDERKRPENFPRQVFCIGTYRADSNSELAKLINDEMTIIIQNQGMIISTNPEQVIDLNNVMTNMKTRVFIPMHMITHMRTDVQLIASMPLAVATGETDTDGKQVLEYQTTEGEVIKPS